jgi:RNA 2',3'-cyclic 3'-phosphodiesterase
VTQLTLPGIEVPQRAVARALSRNVFFAVMPDPDTAARVAHIVGGLRSALHIEAPMLLAGRLHISLHHVSDFARMPEGAVADACAAAATIDMPPFDVSFDRVVSFEGRPGNFPLVLKGSAEPGELTALQQTLGRALAKKGLRVPRRRFTPHLTLLYEQRRFGPRAIEPVTWTVHEFVLIDSWVGKTHYDIKGRWPLKG